MNMLPFVLGFGIYVDVVKNYLLSWEPWQSAESLESSWSQGREFCQCYKKRHLIARNRPHIEAVPTPMCSSGGWDIM
jgi:hypothetical protein